jgi:hypothetical protein
MRNFEVEETFHCMWTAKATQAPLSLQHILNEQKKIILQQQQKQQEKDSAGEVSTTNKDKIRRSKQAHVGFANLTQMIAKRWKAVDPEYKKELEEVSRTDS